MLLLTYEEGVIHTVLNLAIIQYVVFFFLRNEAIRDKAKTQFSSISSVSFLFIFPLEEWSGRQRMKSISHNLDNKISFALI